MKKKTVVISIIAVIVVCAVIGIAVLAVQRGGISMIFTKPEEVKVKVTSKDAVVAYGRELMTTVETEEEGKQIAEIYGITFVKFADGIAEYTTERPVDEVIAEGEKNGYPKLSINYIRKPTN